MPKKAMETLTESMLYLLMAFTEGPLCGTGAAAFIAGRSSGRIIMGPATLYTLLARFSEQGYIREIDCTKGMRTYEITKKGRDAYDAELRRLQTCLDDAAKGSH